MIRAIAIDDEPMPLNILARYSQEMEGLSLAKTFTNTRAAKKWLSENPVDLLFLDINMPAQSGLDFFKSLEDTCMVIFTTAHSEYAVDGFNLNAVDYLLKPYSLERFKQAVHKAMEFHQFLSGKTKNNIFVKADYSIIKIPTQEILFIEAYTDYLKIHRINKKMIVSRMTMSSILEMLPEDFIRVHRSYIVSIHRIDQRGNKRLTIGDNEIPIGKTYSKEVQELFKSNG
ncbi:LytTR family DNA-binding domain-containing protein [Algoriphagus sp. AGSA1]|uniref:LytR/AlgR family response regulator transcription factor n=1 Tax=Algoriphagus sp. AGSA1 TaxID=2907213 RepID=UPI001F31F21E|nr:LytTR family DNA-binding domain-containing protein [Algoriphagus sp. AGSA1]MCE7054157.1 LytTR family DNA-binding domain-containing protein [Algoriphagus sp. AGSA1]